MLLCPLSLPFLVSVNNLICSGLKHRFCNSLSAEGYIGFRMISNCTKHLVSSMETARTTMRVPGLREYQHVAEPVQTFHTSMVACAKEACDASWSIRTCGPAWPHQQWFVVIRARKLGQRDYCDAMLGERCLKAEFISRVSEKEHAITCSAIFRDSQNDRCNCQKWNFDQFCSFEHCT